MKGGVLSSIVLIVSFSISLVYGQKSISMPSDARVHKDLNTFFERYSSNSFLDPAIYKLEGMEQVAFDYTSEDTLTSDQLSIQKFSGSFLSPRTPECLVLITPAKMYPAGPVWGIPYAMLFVYSYHNKNWKLSYAGSFFGNLELIRLNEDKGLNQIHVSIDYCNQGLCQWVTALMHFQNNQLDTLFYTISYNNLMAVAAHAGDSSENVLPAVGDTLAKEIHLDAVKDVDGDKISEVVMKEEIILFDSIKEDDLYYEKLTRQKLYSYTNTCLVLKEVAPFTREKLSQKLSKE